MQQPDQYPYKGLPGGLVAEWAMWCKTSSLLHVEVNLSHAFMGNSMMKQHLLRALLSSICTLRHSLDLAAGRLTEACSSKTITVRRPGHCCQQGTARCGQVCGWPGWSYIVL